MKQLLILQKPFALQALLTMFFLVSCRSQLPEPKFSKGKSDLHRTNALSLELATLTGNSTPEKCEISAKGVSFQKESFSYKLDVPKSESSNFYRTNINFPFYELDFIIQNNKASEKSSIVFMNEKISSCSCHYRNLFTVQILSSNDFTSLFRSSGIYYAGGAFDNGFQFENLRIFDSGVVAVDMLIKCYYDPKLGHITTRTHAIEFPVLFDLSEVGKLNVISAYSQKFIFLLVSQTLESAIAHDSMIRSNNSVKMVRNVSNAIAALEFPRDIYSSPLNLDYK